MMTAQETAEMLRLLEKFKKEIEIRDDIKEQNKKMFIEEIKDVSITRIVLGV